MKPGFLLLLPLLVGPPAGGPKAVQITFKSLTKSAYLQAQKGCIATKPRVTFPLKKEHGRIVIPTAKGIKVFTDKYINTDRDDQAQFEYLGYLPEFESHVVLGHFYEWSQWFLLNKNGQHIALYDAPLYSPDLRGFVVVSPGIGH